MCGSMVNIQFPTAKIRRGKKEERRKKKEEEETTGQNIMSASATQGGHNKVDVHKAFATPFTQTSASFCPFSSTH